MQLLSDTSPSPTAFKTKTLKWSSYKIQFANPDSRSTFLFGFGALSKSVSLCVILCNLRVKTWQISRLQTCFSRYNCIRIIFHFLPHIHTGFLSEVSHKPCFLLIFRSNEYSYINFQFIILSCYFVSPDMSDHSGYLQSVNQNSYKTRWISSHLSN